ncbi:envelope stress response membrane protein PspB [Providencia hangzhouensis]
MATLQQKNSGQGSQLTENEVQRLMQLAEQASQMQQRIKTLEDILDAEHPNWRQK